MFGKLSALLMEFINFIPCDVLWMSRMCKWAYPLPRKSGSIAGYGNLFPLPSSPLVPFFEAFEQKYVLGPHRESTNKKGFRPRSGWFPHALPPLLSPGKVFWTANWVPITLMRLPPFFPLLCRWDLQVLFLKSFLVHPTTSDPSSFSAHFFVESFKTYSETLSKSCCLLEVLNPFSRDPKRLLLGNLLMQSWKRSQAYLKSDVET